jgi:hypothetical protein
MTSHLATTKDNFQISDTYCHKLIKLSDDNKPAANMWILEPHL